MVSCGSSNKLPQTLWLKTTEIKNSGDQNYEINTVGQNQGIIRVALPPEISEQNLFFASSIFLWLPEFLGFRPLHLNLQSLYLQISLSYFHMYFSFVCVCVCMRACVCVCKCVYEISPLSPYYIDTYVCI
uniref:Uncharacterized protein n=1 Tax=Rousettus aegyptiacus TaxID=9407 RepID=A0A7J8HRD7_ROUAE|nr:hypothetical protein HJG63_010996 [Rousettus aegyptiacus]